MQINIKNIFKIIVCVILIIFFTIGFNQGQEIDDLAYCIAIGIDTSEQNNIKVSFQFAKPVNTSEGTSSDGQPSFIHTIDASSLTSSINILNSFMNKRVNLSHCKVIVFSEEFAKKGISEEIYTLMNNVQIRPDVSLVICRCNASYYIKKSKPTLENIVTKYYETAPQSTEYTGYTYNTKIADFFNNLNCSTCEPVAVLGGVNTESQQKENSNLNNIEKDSIIKAGQTPISKESSAESIGLAIFKGDKLVRRSNCY